MSTDNTKIALPPAMSLIKSAVAAIPIIGGALDHLLFDGADEVRINNVEQSLDNISNYINQIENNSIDKEWFSSVEAISVFRNLIDKVQFEPDTKKIEALSKVVVNSGTHDHSSDKRKLSVLNHLGTLSFVQMKLLKIISQLPLEARKVSGGSLEQTLQGVWLNKILEAVKGNPDGNFWEGTMKLDLELEILCANNTLERVQSMVGGNDAVYKLTLLGKMASAYLQGL